MNEYKWYIRLTDDSEHEFFQGPIDVNPLENYEGFDAGDNWNVYAPTMEGNDLVEPNIDDYEGFFLVPKLAVAEVWSVQVVP